MITLALAVAFLAPASNSADRWIAELLASKPAKAVHAKASPRPLASASTSGGTVHSSGAFESHDSNVTVVAVDFKPLNYATHHMSDLLDAGKTEEAFTFISEFRDSHPDLADFLPSFVIDCELLSGRYADAYKESVVFIKAHTGPGSHIGEQFYLQLSLAAAGCGQVYAGQDEYCVKWFQKHYSESWSSNKTINLSLAQGDQRKLMILSSLALAVSSRPAQAYLESVLKLDPTADVAGRLLVDYDQIQGRYSDLRRVATFMIAHVKDSGSNDFYRSQIASVSGLADRPKFRRSDSQVPATP